MEYLIYGMILIYILSTLICLMALVIGNSFSSIGGLNNFKGIVNSFIPILNTLIILRNL